MGFHGGVHMPDVSEIDVTTSLAKEHQPLIGVIVTRQRNLRIIYNIWQSKDVKVLYWT
jgi:hypothetical protein